MEYEGGIDFRGVASHFGGFGLSQLVLFVLAPALDRPAAGREPPRRRELERRFGRKLPQRLHQTLAEGRRSDDQRAVVILQRACDDFSGTRGAPVRQDDHRQVRPRLRLRVAICAGRIGRPAAGLYHLLARVEKQVADRHPLIEQSARIAAQVQHERLHPLLGERAHGIRQLLRRGLTDGCEQDVADLVVQHHRDLDRTDVDRRARQLEGDRLVHADPAHLQLHRAPRLAAQLLHGLIVLPTLGRPPVQRDDLVTRLDAGAFRRRLG